MYGEGTCVENTVTVPLEKRKDDTNAFSNSKEDYEFQDVTFTKSCQCEIIKSSLFSLFVK